jgi:hypothetical protein
VLDCKKIFGALAAVNKKEPTVAVQPETVFVAVTLYVPCPKPLIVEAVVAKLLPPLDQTKLNGPEVPLAVIEPLLLQVGETFETLITGNALTVTGKLKVLGQPYLVIPPTIDLE